MAEDRPKPDNLFSHDRTSPPHPGPHQEKPVISLANLTSRDRFPVIQLLLGAVCLIYLLQMYTPLRLNTDAVVLLSVAESVANGHGFLDNGAPTVHPPGYPAVAAALLWFGVASSQSLVFLNYCGLAVTLLVAAWLLRVRFEFGRTVCLAILAMTLLAWPTVKHATLPLSEFLFMAFCWGALGVQYAAFSRRSLRLLLLSWLLVLAAIAVRRVGVTLIPSFSLCLVSLLRPRRSVPRRAVLTYILIAMACLSSAWFVVARTSTLVDFHPSHPIQSLARTLAYRTTELGQIALNLPERLGTYGPVPVAAGLVLTLLLLAGIYSRRNGLTPVEVFFVTYCACLAVWPFPDVRFWLPLLPLLFAYALLGSRQLRWHRESSPRPALYFVYFLLAGLAALAYSTRISLAGPRFPELYGNGSLRATYCADLGGCPPEVDAKQVDFKVLHLLKTFR
jgi:hypothetical protein